jgi:hypothetical protein
MRNELSPIAAITLVLGLLPWPVQAAPDGFIRGDSNGDGLLDLSDPIHVIDYLFLDGSMRCLDAADFDGSSGLDLTDCVAALTYLFLDGPPPPEPFPACGLAEGGPLGCATFTCEIMTGDSIWEKKPDGCKQCGECTAPTLEVVVQDLSTQGINVLDARLGQESTVCAGCACASGRYYTVLVSPGDAAVLEGRGWKPATQ